MTEISDLSPEMLIKAARAIGKQAAEHRLAELQMAGPQWSVHQTGFGEKQTKENMVGTMLDLCGGAFLVVTNARTAKFRQLKKYQAETEVQRRDFTQAEDDYPLPGFSPFSMAAVMQKTGKTPDTRWSLRYDDYRKRYCLSIYDMCNRQEISVNEAAARAAAQVIREWGLDVRIETYID